MKNRIGHNIGRWLLLASVLLVVPPARARADEPSDRPGVGVFVQPIGTVGVAAGGALYAPLGVELPLTRSSELVLEATAVSGNWLGCASTSNGAWVAAGVAYFTRGYRAAPHGFFIEPKLIGRFFSTAHAHAGGFLFGCSNTVVNGDDYELHLGIDAGYAIRVGQLEITPVLGASVGFCGNCVDGGPFFEGQLFDGPHRRADRLSLGLNLNLVRVGLRF